MAHRSQKAIGIAALLLASLPAFAAEYTFNVRHERLLKDHSATLTIGEDRISFLQIDPKGNKPPAKLDRGDWSYGELQQLLIGDGRIIVLLYKDRSLLLAGVDREYEFYLTPGQDLSPAIAMLKRLLDRRLVIASAAGNLQSDDTTPAKISGAFRGAQGLLKLGPDSVVFETSAKGQSRTWRLADISNVSSADPYQLTLITHERAKSHYGNMRDYSFQLSRPVGQKWAGDLWKRLNHEHGLLFLKAFEEKQQ